MSLTKATIKAVDIGVGDSVCWRRPTILITTTTTNIATIIAIKTIMVKSIILYCGGRRLTLTQLMDIPEILEQLIPNFKLAVKFVNVQ